MRNDSFDYVIVGAGSAGCVLANPLSEDPSTRVLLLEAGPRDWNPWIHISAGYFKTMHNPRTNWCYLTDPDPGLKGRSIQWPRGKVLGGSSAINGLLYIRGHAQDYNQWGQLGNQGWSYDDVLPYFKKAENQERGADQFHGAGGPLSVSNLRIKRHLCDAYIDAAEEIGLPRNSDFNGANQEGAGYFQTTTRNGRRCSTAVGYLRPAKQWPNLRIVTSTLVEGIELDGLRAVGVRCSHQGTTTVFHARCEVILAAGAIGSAQLLQLSGIGNPAVLRDVSVGVRHELPGEGLHPFSAFTASVCQLRPENRGRIVLKSPDPAHPPSIQTSYLGTLTDQMTTVAGMKLSRKLVATQALAPYVAEELLPGVEVQSDEALLDHARDVGQTIYHPVGTCKMGKDANAVVDPRLRVHGIGGLRVVDASIMPTLVSGNTNAPTIMIGEDAQDAARSASPARLTGDMLIYCGYLTRLSTANQHVPKTCPQDPASPRPALEEARRG